MSKPGRPRIGTTFGLVAILAVAVIGVLGAFGLDDLPAEIPDEDAALCLACVALGAGSLPRMLCANRLTSREDQISRHVAFGWTNQDIATHLGISERTIETHLSHVYAKVGLANRVQLALLLRGHQDARGPTH